MDNGLETQKLESARPPCGSVPRARLQGVQARIASAASEAARGPAAVGLPAVSKTFGAAAARALAAAMAVLPDLCLRGIMAIPAPTADEAAQRAAFRQVRKLSDDLNMHGHAPDTLSTGMPGDLEAAILEGATLVRIGTALFGERIKHA